jgi:hypothetical protein
MVGDIGVKKENKKNGRIMELLKKLDLKTILILVLIIVILLMRSCTPVLDHKKPGTVKVGGKKYIVVKHEVDTVYQPVTKIVYKKGDTIFIDRPVYVQVPANVDTAEILRDYYTKFPYKDTLTLSEELGFITVNDTIFKNRILNRTFESHINKITVKETTYLETPPKTMVFIGGVAGFDKVNFVNFLGPSLMIKDKQDKLYSIGIGYSNAKTVSIQGGIYWKIKLKK